MVTILLLKLIKVEEFFLLLACVFRDTNYLPIITV
jgi:hypothetical protein